MLEHRDIYAGGRLVPATSPDIVTVANPATEAIVGTAPAAGKADVDAAVRAAREAFEAGPWPRLAGAERAGPLDRLAGALVERADRLAALVTAEMGIPMALSRRHSVDAPVAILRYYAALARSLEPEEIRAAVTFRGHTMVRREPVGVCAVIAPWNYPLAIAVSQLAPALAAGCTAVLKPDAQTSLSAYLLAEAFGAAGFPPGVFNLVTGADDVAERLARHPGVDKVAFSGRASMGRRLGAVCGESLKPVNLDVGGDAAAIVLEDADLADTCAALSRLAFANSGQTCFAASRVLAPRSRFREVLAGLADHARALVVGDPAAPQTAMGPLVSPRGRARVEAYVGRSLAAGARVAAGGRRPAGQFRGYFHEPTVLAGELGTAPAGEVFGPVVTVLPYTGEAQAVALANDGCCGLAGTVWTADPAHGLELARSIRAGTFGVNLYVPDLGAPWGGRSAGHGSAYGPEGLDSYLRPRSVFVPGS